MPTLLPATPDGRCSVALGRPRPCGTERYVATQDEIEDQRFCGMVPLCNEERLFANFLTHLPFDICRTRSQNSGTRVGYARVSTDEQSLDLQRDALARVGCERLFEDRGVSGVAMRRPGLDQALVALASRATR